GQLKKECRPFSLATLNAKPSLMLFNNIAGDIEADAQPGIGGGVFADLVELLKDFLLVLQSDADTKVLHEYNDVALPGCHAYNDLISAPGVFNCVRYQVCEHLPDAISIAIDMRLYYLFQENLMRLCRSLDIFDCLLD